MSTNLCSNQKFSDYDREFSYEIACSAIFSSFYSAVEFRRDHEGLTHKELADRLGTDKTRVSKLLSGPANWTIKTIAELAYSLDLEIEFTLVDKADKRRCFMPHGEVSRATTRRVAPIMQSIALNADMAANEQTIERMPASRKRLSYGRRMKTIREMSLEAPQQAVFMEI